MSTAVRSIATLKIPASGESPRENPRWTKGFRVDVYPVSLVGDPTTVFLKGYGDVYL